MKRILFYSIFLIFAFLTVLTCVVSCANMGSGPDGGPYDETPPRIVGMTSPSQVASGVMGKSKKHKSTKFQLLFNELITIDNPSENVIVSPPQIEQPNITAVGKKITVELLDSLKPNTTYTVDFSDAIKDNNEGNPLGHYTYIFSTGEKTDTMQMSGHVLNAEDLEPIAGILVGLYPIDEDTVTTLTAEKAELSKDTVASLLLDSLQTPLQDSLRLAQLITGPADRWLTDTLFTTTPFDRVARTDANGYFSIKGVAEGKRYHIYALKDADGDFKFSQRAEIIAFSKDILTPSAFPDTRYDTLWIDTTRYDSIRVIPYTHYLPDDICLLAFQEANQPRNLLKQERNDLENFKIYFTAPSKHVPTIEGLNFDAKNAFIEERNEGNDTITYWLKDSLLMQQDTLDFVYTYMNWEDSLQQHVLKSDTLSLTSKTSWAKRMEQKRKEDEKWQKQVEKRHKKGDYSQDERPQESLKMNISVSSTIAPNENVSFSFYQPIDTIDLSKIHLSLMVDTVATAAEYLLDTVPHNILGRKLYAEWRPEQKYVLTIDSAAVYNIYGVCNNPLKKEFSVENMEKYGTLFINLTNLEKVAQSNPNDTVPFNPYEHTIVQLLDKSGKVSYSVHLNKQLAEFYFLKEGEYFIRCIVDRNDNEKWDSGVWEKREPAEDVFYNAESFNIRAGWDDNIDWDLSVLQRDKQKPSSLVKQKKNNNNKSSAHERNIRRLEDRSGKNKQNNSSSNSSLGMSSLRF